MATGVDIAFGVVGVVGVALDASIKTYGFISSIGGAPQAIKTLSDHIQTLKTFLVPFHDVISKPAIRNRPQNVNFLPGVEMAVSGFEGILQKLEDEVKRYVKYDTGSSSPSWAGWGSYRRLKYAFRKSSIVELQAALLGRMSALHMTLAPLDLNWTTNLSEEDRASIVTLQQRASTLEVASLRRSPSSTTLASLPSTSNQASHVDQTPTNTDESERTKLDLGNSNPDSDDQDSEAGSEDYNPFRTKLTVWSGEHNLTTNAIIDTGSSINLISQRLVTKLGAPINRLTTRPTPVRGFEDEIWTLGTVTLVLQRENSTEYSDMKAHVLPELAGISFGLLLGAEWLMTTATYIGAKTLSL